MRLRRIAVLAALTAVAVAGCGAAEKLSPQVAVRNAARSTADDKSGTFTLSVVGSEDDLNSVLNHGAALSADDRKGLGLLAASHIAVTTADGVFGLDVKVGGIDHAVQLRYVDKKLFARADVPALVEMTGGSKAEVDATVAGLAAHGLGFLKDGAAGKWLEADLGPLGDMLKGLGEQFGGAGGSTSTTGVGTGSQFDQVRDAVGKALSENVAVDRQGSDAAGDHYVVTAHSLRALYAALTPALSQLPMSQKLPGAAQIPDRPVAIDTWLKGGRVARVEVPLNQFFPAAQGGRVAVRLDIAREADAVTAPDGAVPVDLKGIIQTFMGGLSGLGGLSGAGFPGLNIPGLNGVTG